MVDDLILYKMDRCPYCVVVQKELSRLGVVIEQRETSRNSPWRTDLKSKTGRTQVPCLFIKGAPMFESVDIVFWLRQHFESG